MLGKGHGGLEKAPTKKKEEGEMLTGERETRSSLLILVLKEGK